MLEIERKILEIDPQKLLKKIKAAYPSSKVKYTGAVMVWYFDHPDMRIKKRNDLLRVREFTFKKGEPFTEVVYKTFKGVKKGSKYFEEEEVVIPGLWAKTLEKICLATGLKKTMYYEKRRTLVVVGKAKCEIDEYPRIPPFVEIEAGSPKAIDAVIKKLGLQEHEQSAESITELLPRKYPKVKLNGLRFK